MNKVIIWGSDDFNTLGLLRELGPYGLNIFFLIRGRKKFAYKSKYCTKYKETKSNQDGYDFLITHYSKESHKPIIITSGDGISVFMDQKKAELEKYFILPICSQQGTIEKYTDKYSMTQLALNLGIKCPNSWLVQRNSSIENVTYPCIIKPSHQKPGHYNEFKFKICKTKADLEKILSLVRQDSVFIVQQLIENKLDVLIYGCRLPDNSIKLAGCFIRDRWADSGSSSHGVITNVIPECIDIDKIKDFLNRIDYHGLFSFEYGMVNDTAYFFEVNMRNDGTSHYFYQTGANIPLSYVYACSGEDYSKISTMTIGNQYFIDELFDIENVLHRNISYGQWRKDCKQATVFKYFDKNDMEPYHKVKRTMLIQLIQDIALKKLRLYIVFIGDKIGLRK